MLLSKEKRNFMVKEVLHHSECDGATLHLVFTISITNKKTPTRGVFILARIPTQQGKAQ